MSSLNLADPMGEKNRSRVCPAYTGPDIEEGVGDMCAELDAGGTERKGSDRRTFLRTSGGVATGIAVTVLPSGIVALASPAAAGAKEAPARLVDPQGDVPSEPVMAYVHDADKGIVTVISGTTERTYHNPGLVKRLLDAANPPQRG